uniref:Glucagon / GIP / secretin / VIP family domain-containing protein n=1 Tax=Poecilia mexicana TaxID=48701 RepID=A0A3B3X099_9TELE
TVAAPFLYIKIMETFLPAAEGLTVFSRRIGPDIIQNFKRHSDGTFTSDFINNLDRMKAKDFVEWLSSLKQER